MKLESRHEVGGKHCDRGRRLDSHGTYMLEGKGRINGGGVSGQRRAQGGHWGRREWNNVINTGQEAMHAKEG